VCNWFTEGRNTADLEDARALLAIASAARNPVSCNDC
jgi:hypothetical protein